MNHLYTLCLTTILTIHNLHICQATLYTHVNNVKEDHMPQTAHYYQVAVNEAAAAHKEEANNRPENQLKFFNIQKNGLNHHQNTRNYYQSYANKKQAINHPSKLYTSVDYNVGHDNDVEQFADEDLYDFGQQQEKPSLIKQLQSQHQELSEGYGAIFFEEPYQVVAPPKAESGSSNEQQYLTTAYVTPAPASTNFKMHPNLQHRQQKFINKPKIVSYPTGGNEALPKSTTTTTSIKSQYGVKYVTANELNAYDNSQTNGHIRQPALVYGQPGARSASKQYAFAPMRSHMERKLPYSSKTLPYPPSFITFTTTEKPSYNYYKTDHKSAYKRIPDLFSHRQTKSLLDSYIPSWQVSKMLHHYEIPRVQKNYNLHTLAFVMPYKTTHKREVTKHKM